MKAQFLITMVIVALCVGSGIADELKIEFYGDAQGRFEGNVPIEASTIRKDGKVLIIVKNVSSDFISMTKHAQGWSMKYLKDGKWRDDAGSIFPVDTDSLDHVILRPQKNEKSRQTKKTIFEIPSSHEDDTMAEIQLSLGAYFPSVRDYVEFSIVAKITLEAERGEQAGAGQPATAPDSKSEGGDKPKPVSEPAPR